jgi:hypothetical protein
MSIPTLYQACYQHHRATVVNACPCCADVQYPEARLCDLVREGQRWYRLHGRAGDRLGDLHGRVQRKEKGVLIFIPPFRTSIGQRFACEMTFI